jgi:hypothetical protein
MEISQISMGVATPGNSRQLNDLTAFFSIRHIEKPVRKYQLTSGILSFRYVARDQDNVVHAHSHNGHTNYCLAWALSEPQVICS